MTKDLLSTALSETELEILQRVATGATNREIAHERHISEATVKKHISNINLKLGSTNRTEAMRRAIEMGLVTVSTPADRGEGGDTAGANDEARARDLEVARRLADELDRTRRRHRRMVRGLLAAALALAAVAAYAVYLVTRSGEVAPAARPTRTPGAHREVAGPFWVPGGRLAPARSGLALAVIGQTVYAIGGESEAGVLGETLRYAPGMQGLVVQWEKEPPKPTAVRDVAAVVVEEHIFVPGGCTADGRATDVVEVFDPAARAWSPAPRLPAPACGYGLVALDGRIYLFGGRRGDDVATVSDAVWTYRPGDAAWEVLPEVDRMPQPRADLAAVLVEREVHLIGGRDQVGQPRPDHWIFRPFQTVKWDTATGPALPEGRAGLVGAGIVQPGIAPDIAQLRRWIYVVGGGWDRNLQPGALLLDLGAPGMWRPFADVGEVTAGQTPQRGASLVTRYAGGQLILVGGRAADGTRLSLTYLINFNRAIDLGEGP